MTRQALYTQNFHLVGRSLTSKKIKRKIFDRLKGELDLGLIMFLTGIRRGGKSTLLKQLIQYLWKEKGTPAEQILFWEFSNLDSIESIQEILEFFLQEITDINKSVYIFFDEIQFVKGYENIIKLYYDRYENLKFVLTGSLSLSYKKRMAESLAGRFIEHRLLPLSFLEYLKLSEKKDLLQKFDQAQKTNSLAIKQGLAIDLNPEFRKFLQFGRFPDLLELPERYQIKSYLQGMILQSLNQDSIDYFGITKPRAINLLYQYVQNKNSGEISQEKISRNLSLSYQTVSHYLDILELLGLVYPLINTKNPLKITKARKKYYTSSSLSLYHKDQILDSDLGQAVESYVLEQFLNQGQKIYFYRYRNSEVDLIDYKNKTAWEVKFRANIKKSDYSNLLKISSKLNLEPKLVTLNQSQIDNTEIPCTPACLLE